MKTYAVIGMIVLFFSGLVLAQDSGGVVYCNGKEGLYYDFQTKQETTITGDLLDKNKKPVPVSLAAVSEDARYMVFLGPDRKLYARQLPKGIPYLTATRADAKDRNSSVADIPVIVSGDVKNLRVSSDGGYYSYEVRSSAANFGPQPALQRDMADMLIQSYSRPDEQYRDLVKTWGHPGATYQGQPFYATWSKDELKYAFIWKTKEGWGPIQVSMDPTLGFVDPRRPTIFITNVSKPVSLKECEGLAFKLDGSITFLSGGTLFSETGAVIAKALNGTNPVWTSDDTLLYRGKDNGLYSWSLKSGATKLRASIPESFTWCKFSPFDTEKIITKVLSPGEGPISGKTRCDGGISEDGIPMSDISKAKAKIIAGGIETRWFSTRSSSTVVIYVGNYANRGQLEFAFAAGSSAESIQDPTKYSFQKLFPEMQFILKDKSTPGGIQSDRIGVYVGQILILKLGTSYAAIRPTLLEPMWKSYEEIPEMLNGTFVRNEFSGCKNIRPIPAYEYLTYEWKYWPAVPQGLLAKKPS